METKSRGWFDVLRYPLVRKLLPVAALVAAVAGCSVSLPGRDVTMNEAMSLFNEACLEDLPDFREFGTSPSFGSLELVSNERGTSYQLPDANLILTNVDMGELAPEVPAFVICGVSFAASDAGTSQIGNSFLSTATRATGGPPQDNITKGSRVYTYHLRNGSVLNYDTGRRGDTTLHTVWISNPQSREDINFLEGL